MSKSVAQQPEQGGTTDPLMEAARLLVAGADTLAISLYAPTLNENPQLKSVRPSDWDFFLTVAFVFVALTQLNHEGLAEARRTSLEDVVSADFEHWSGDAVRAFEDCKAFYERLNDGLLTSPAYAGDNQRLLSAHIIGTWLCWNLFKHAPEDEAERSIASQLGVIATHEFKHWWRSEKVGSP